MKCLLVYNPVSGGSKKFIKKLPYVVSELKKKYEVVDVRATNYAKEAILIGKDACGKYDVLIASGGDGTFSEILQGVGENKNAPTLGYLPSGSCGDIANNHNIPHNLKKALKVILNGNKKTIDLCRINNSYFSYVAGIGTYTAGIYNANQQLKRKIGKAAYYLAAVKETFNVKSYDITITIGKRVYKEKEAILVLVMNSKSVGGFPFFNYKAKMDDGKIDVLVVKKSVFNTPINIWKLFVNGIESYKDNPSIRFYSGDEIQVEVKDAVLWNVDGDKSEFKDIDVKCLKKKITMFVND